MSTKTPGTKKPKRHSRQQTNSPQRWKPQESQNLDKTEKQTSQESGLDEPSTSKRLRENSNIEDIVRQVLRHSKKKKKKKKNCPPRKWRREKRQRTKTLKKQTFLPPSTQAPNHTPPNPNPLPNYNPNPCHTRRIISIRPLQIKLATVQKSNQTLQNELSSMQTPINPNICNKHTEGMAQTTRIPLDLQISNLNQDKPKRTQQNNLW